MFVPTPRAVIADRYEQIEEIGRGGMGSVWRAEHTGLGSACAVKFMLGVFGSDAAIRQRFLREARAAARLQSHHVVRVFDVDEWQGSLYIAMELLEGETLASRIERTGPLSPELTCEVIEQVARALARAHAARLIHRDLKPENVFLVKQEPGEPLLVKVLDFGLAKQLDVGGSHATKTGALLGTPGYMSPEQALGSKAVDERSDLWSLAAVAYHCITGSEPFPGEGVGEILLSVMQGPLPVPSRANASVPPSFDAWWLRSAQRDAAARPSSASVLARELRAALSLAPPARPRSSAIALAETVQAGSPSPSAPPGTKTKVSPAHGLSPQSPSPEPARATFEPAARSAGTLQPASSSRSASRDGFSAYAVGAAMLTTLGGIGLVLWLRTSEPPVRDVPARAASGVTAELRAEMPPAQAELPAAAPPAQAELPAAAPAQAELPAGPQVSPAPSEPAALAAAAAGERKAPPAALLPAKPGPGKAQVPAVSMPAAARPAQPEPPIVTPPAPAAERKHERLGF